MYSGGAHGNIFYHSWNYDKLESRLISLEDLLGENLDENLATLSQMSIEKITELDISDESWIATGAGADVANFSTWYITQEGGLKITFDPYQVAAYAAGPVELVFSQEEISGIIAPKYHPLL